MPNKQVSITKFSGEAEAFSYEKFRRSLRNAGVPSELIKEAVRQIEGKLKEGMSTKEIYRLTFNFLKTKQKSLAAKYSLKKAIFQMGPGGYPFEKFIAKLLEHNGYAVEINKIIQGKCVTHEVDVIAKKKNKTFFVECKFHNRQGIRSDVKVVLYIKERFDDIRRKPEQHAWLVTNTKFSKDAIKYATCVKMKITGWNYPANESLKKIIEDSHLHPLTCLTTLSTSQKRMLLQNGTVLCRQIMEKPGLLRIVNVPKNKQEKILNEIQEVVQ